jgi:hypothetical protein
MHHAAWHLQCCIMMMMVVEREKSRRLVYSFKLLEIHSLYDGT